MKKLAIFAVAALVSSVVSSAAAPGTLSPARTDVASIVQVKAKKMHYAKSMKESGGHQRMNGMKGMRGIKHGNMKGM